ncbi:MAG: hypothetical protein ABFC78_08920 [Methanoregula sp.]
MTRPDRCRVLVLLSSPDLTGPARCSRDTAKVAVFRLASSHPDRKPVPVDRKMLFAPVGPAQQSERQVADAPCNRRFVPPPG